MTYTNGLQVFFDRLNYKHSIKGDSFLSMNQEELRELLDDEIEEWKQSKKGSYHEIEELQDIMICCLLNLETLLRDCNNKIKEN